MNYHTKYSRDKSGISLDLPVGYKKVWAARIPEIKIMLLSMSIKEIALHYGVTAKSLTSALKYYGVSAIAVRHYHRIAQEQAA